MSVRLNGSISGYTELDAPAVAGNNVLKLPANSGSPYQSVRNGATPGELEFYTPPTMTLATAVASTSGTSIDFTGIPSWVKRVTVMFDGVSLNGSANHLFQLGYSGGVENTGYISSSNYLAGGYSSGTASSTSGIVLIHSSSPNALSGYVSFLNITGNKWVAAGVFNLENIAGYTFYTAGSKTLSGTLDRVRITNTSGTDTFDAGTINIMYEG